jgi:hypothetical protein
MKNHLAQTGRSLDLSFCLALLLYSSFFLCWTNLAVQIRPRRHHTRDRPPLPLHHLIRLRPMHSTIVAQEQRRRDAEETLLGRKHREAELEIRD